MLRLEKMQNNNIHHCIVLQNHYSPEIIKMSVKYDSVHLLQRGPCV